MSWQFPIYTPVFMLSVCLSLWLGITVWRHGKAPGAQVFAVMLFASGFWSFMHILEIGVDQAEAKIFWSKIQYLGSVVVGPAWFVFTIYYSRQLKRFPRRYSFLLAILPIVTVLLTWTNEAHHLIWTTITPSETNPKHLNYGHGIVFWIAILYNHSLVFAGVANVLRKLRASPKGQRTQPTALLIGALVPIGGSLLYLTGLSPIEGEDLTPFVLTITGIIYLLAVLRYQLFDIRRVARAAIIEGMRDGMLIIDEINRLIDVNPSALQLLGVSRAIVEQDINHSLAAYPVILEIIRHPQVRPPVTVAIGDGEPQHLDVQVSELNDHAGNRAGKLVVLRDVTERLMAEKVAFETAIEQHRLQLLTQFIRDISHEFRTPLSIIHTSLYLMEKSSDSDYQKDRRKIIEEQAKRLDSLISEMLITVKLDSNSTFEPMVIDLNSLLQTVTHEQRPIFTSKQQQLILHPSGEKVQIAGDLFMLQKAVSNILQNASRYTPDGGTITVTSRRENQAAIIEIRDSGIGMSEETKARIFERFFRADTAHSTPGFGLGLPIAQTIVEKHHGHITVESVLGAGTTFTIRLPQAPENRIAISA